MKRTLKALALLALVLVLASCGKTEVKEVDIAEAAAKLYESVTFEDSLSVIDDEAVKYLYGMPEGTTAVVYMGSGATAEELAVFDAGEGDVEAVAAAAAEHIAAQIESFRNYKPSEIAKLESALIERFGRYVCICVTSDSGASAAISEIFG